VGSPNLGRRSVDRDLESAVVLLTRHPGLQHALAEERRRLFEVHTETIDDAVFERPDRKIGPQILGWANGNWIRVAMPILQPYF
jgi:CDP-diacylglycerol--glycerol-3-phosphate 3-phosphatidyltransferase